MHDPLVFGDELSDAAEENYDSDNPDEEGHYTHEYPDELDASDDSSARGGSSKASDSSGEEPDWRDTW